MIILTETFKQFSGFSLVLKIGLREQLRTFTCILFTWLFIKKNCWKTKVYKKKYFKPYLCCELFLFEMKIGAKPILSTEVNFVAEKRDNF